MNPPPLEIYILMPPRLHNAFYSRFIPLIKV